MTIPVEYNLVVEEKDFKLKNAFQIKYFENFGCHSFTSNIDTHSATSNFPGYFS